MEKRDILISWLAIINDFTNSGDINETGPTISIHKYHWLYKKHIIFYTKDYETKALKMLNYLRSVFGHEVIIRPVEIKGVFVNLPQIKSITEAIVIEYIGKKIDFAMSMGTGVMKIVWYILHTSGKYDSRLTVISPPYLNKNKKIPDYKEIIIESSNTPFNALIREKQIKSEAQSPILLTKQLEEVYDKAYKLAVTDNVTVLITGNTGTGKEILANFIHKNSPRKNKPFISINCSAFADQLLESRLFGHKKGSFTDAREDHIGILEQADGGTVFLDEIGDISPYMQQALLRFLQHKEIQPIGGKVKKVNTRIIAATNKNLHELIQKQQFRSDLLYRLGLCLHLPDLKDYPKKEKKQWILHILKQKRKYFKTKEIPTLSKEVWDFLLEYDYPGNIRELENIIDHFYVFGKEKITPKDLPAYLSNLKKTFIFNNNLPMTLDEVEKQHIINVLHSVNGKKTLAAKKLNIAYNTLVFKMKKYGIE